MIASTNPKPLDLQSDNSSLSDIGDESLRRSVSQASGAVMRKFFSSFSSDLDLGGRGGEGLHADFDRLSEGGESGSSASESPVHSAETGLASDRRSSDDAQQNSRLPSAVTAAAAAALHVPKSAAPPLSPSRVGRGVSVRAPRASLLPPLRQLPEQARDAACVLLALKRDARELAAAAAAMDAATPWHARAVAPAFARFAARLHVHLSVADGLLLPWLGRRSAVAASVETHERLRKLSADAAAALAAASSETAASAGATNGETGASVPLRAACQSVLEALREEAVSVITALDAHFTPREYELELRDAFWRSWLTGLAERMPASSAGGTVAEAAATAAAEPSATPHLPAGAASLPDHRLSEPAPERRASAAAVEEASLESLLPWLTRSCAAYSEEEALILGSALAPVIRSRGDAAAAAAAAAAASGGAGAAGLPSRDEAEAAARSDLLDKYYSHWRPGANALFSAPLQRVIASRFAEKAGDP